MTTVKKRKSASRGRPAASVKAKAGKAKKTTIKSVSPLAALKQKIAAQKVEFLGKLKSAVDTAYAKGVADVLRDQKKRDAEKAKLLAVAERKFEKKYAQITAKKATKAKKSKKATAKKATAKATVKKTSTVKKSTAPKVKTGSRGRPPKSGKATTVSNIPVVSQMSTGSNS